MERRAETAAGDYGGGADFFISYTGSDRTWAEWIAWELEDAGYRVVIQAWDFRPGSDFVAAMRGITARADRTLAVLSPEYLHSDFALSEWAAAYAADPLGQAGKLLPVSVADFSAEGLDRSRVGIDLVGLEEDEARQRLLAGLSRDRAKPQCQPAFPRPRVATSAPRFPLSLPPVWNLPHHPNPNFTGRADLLAALDATAGSTPIVLCQAITGLGGVGKTQLAAEYAYRHRGDYDVAWWVRAEDPESLLEDLAALAPALGIEVATELPNVQEGACSWHRASLTVTQRQQRRWRGKLRILRRTQDGSPPPTPEAGPGLGKARRCGGGPARSNDQGRGGGSRRPFTEPRALESPPSTGCLGLWFGDQCSSGH